MRLELLDYVKDHLPEGFSPYYIYAIIVDGKEVGRLVLREGHDEERYFDGHVAYHIDEEYRGHGYAYQACLLLKEKIESDHVLITCDPNNIASQKTIEKLDTQYLETRVIPSHLKKQFGQDENEKRIYIWKITS